MLTVRIPNSPSPSCRGTWNKKHPTCENDGIEISSGSQNRVFIVDRRLVIRVSRRSATPAILKGRRLIDTVDELNMLCRQLKGCNGFVPDIVYEATLDRRIRSTMSYVCGEIMTTWAPRQRDATIIAGVETQLLDCILWLQKFGLHHNDMAARNVMIKKDKKLL